MRGRQVIVVDRVLDHQLPVGRDVVFLHAGDDLHLPGRRLVDHEVDVVLGAGEIVDERRRVLVEVHEPEAAILLEPRRTPQPEFLLVEALGIGVVAGHARERAVIGVGPAVIDAHEAPRIALALGADDGAAVPAGVEQAVVDVLGVAHEDHRPAGDLAGDEIARLLQLGGVADIDPAAAEDVGHLLAQDVLRDQHLAVQQEGFLFAIVDDVGSGHGFRTLASRSLGRPWGSGLGYRAAGNRVKCGADARGKLPSHPLALFGGAAKARALPGRIRGANTRSN